MFKEVLENVSKKRPLIHNITNYVTVNDCANIILAAKGSPIMADEEKEVVDITSICDGLNINIGTLNSRTINSMLLAGKQANKLNHPVVLDVVGVGASTLRNNTAIKLINEINFSVIKGNISEIKALATKSNNTKGVDASDDDIINNNNLDDIICLVKEFAYRMKSIIVVSGPIDIVSDGKDTYCIYNGHEMMSSITGTGCQLAALITTLISANKDNILLATVSAVCMMGYAGEIAYQRLNKLDGNISYRNYIIDAIYKMDSNMLCLGAKHELR